MSLAPSHHVFMWTAMSLWLMILGTDLTKAEPSPGINLQHHRNLLIEEVPDTYNEDMLDNNIEFGFNPRYSEKMTRSRKSKNLLRDYFSPMDRIDQNVYNILHKAWHANAKDILEKRVMVPNREFNSAILMPNDEKRDTGTGVGESSPYFQAVNSHSCSCGAESKLLDLGPGYYPRYLTKSVCVPLAHWLPANQCHSKTLKVAVLKRRAEGEVQEENTPQLPPVLRTDWLFVVVQLPVACDCMP